MLPFCKKGERMSTELDKTEKKIRECLAKMTTLGAMRPGTLSVQYRNPKEKRIPFNQLSYTLKGKSRSEYVRPESLPTIRRELQAYKAFRRLVAQVTDLSLAASRLRHKRK
jgi:hypothetical protein